MKKIIHAGALVIEAVYPRMDRRDSERARAAKRKASTEAQKRMNQIYSWQKLELMLAANFRPGDLVVTLTYDDAHLPESRKASELRLKYFRQQLAAHRLMTGQGLVMIWNTEHKHGDGRWHHHTVINATGDDYDLIRRLWIYGSDIEIKGTSNLNEITISQIEPNPNQPRHEFDEQALKELAMSIREIGIITPITRKWSYTRNARKPEVETFRVEEDTTVQIPKGATEISVFSDSNQYGSARVIKYLAPGWEKRPTVRAKRRRRKVRT